MSDKLDYVHGYGFCLTDDTGKHALNLDGDGARTEDKQMLLDAFARIVAERVELRSVLGLLRLHRTQVEEEPVPSALLNREYTCLEGCEEAGGE